MPAFSSTHATYTRYLIRPAERIAYEVSGTGPLVVLLPGMAELRSSYRHLAPALESAGCTVATTDIVALIDELGGPAIIVGNSPAAGARVIAGAKPTDFGAYRDAVAAGFRRRDYARAFSQTVRGADHAPAKARVARVTAPSLVVMGALDPDFPDPATEARWIGERLHAAVVMVPDAGRYPHAQQPEQTTTAILDLLATVTVDA